MDYELVFEGRMLSGNAYGTIRPMRSLSLTPGNAGSLQIYFNNQDIGSIGPDRSGCGSGYSLKMGWFSPTATVTPTPTMTPEVTATANTYPNTNQ